MTDMTRDLAWAGATDAGDFTGAMDARMYWYTTATTGDVVWQLAWKPHPAPMPCSRAPAELPPHPAPQLQPPAPMPPVPPAPPHRPPTQSHGPSPEPTRPMPGLATWC